MTLIPETKYPYRRAFVVRLRGDATPSALAGRLENLFDGRQTEFASGPELLASIAAGMAPLAGTPADRVPDA